MPERVAQLEVGHRHADVLADRKRELSDARIRVVKRNVVLAHEFHSMTREVVNLQRQRANEERTIRRLRVPAGTIPEIHDRLHLTRSDEAIIYVKGASFATAAP